MHRRRIDHSNPRSEDRRHNGFTLIELLVVLAITAILAAIAYPSYLGAVRKAKRAEARAALLQAMQQQERFYSQRSTYVAFSASSSDEDEKRFKWYSGGTASSSAYEISGRACPGTSLRDCVQLAAVPGTAKVDRGYRDPVCGTLTFTSTGVQGADGAGCWN